MRGRGVYIHKECLLALVAPHDFHPEGMPPICERCRAHRIDAVIEYQRLYDEGEKRYREGRES